MFQYPRRIEPLVQHGEADLAEYEIQVSVSSSDRASGATPVRQLVALLLGVFQYPRRIEPLVQPGRTRPGWAGSSRFQYPRRIEPLVQPGDAAFNE